MGLTEIIIVIASLVAVHAAGAFGSRRGRTDFLLAERSMSLPLLVATLVATWYGAVLASGEFVMRYGVVFILCFGVPYYLVAVAYAGWLSGRIRSGMAASIPEQIGHVHGPAARRLAAALLLVITVPASYQLMLGYVFVHLTGMPLSASILVSTVISIAYVAVGGLRSDAYANVIQVVLMYGGMLALTIAAVTYTGQADPEVSLVSTELFNVPGTLGWAGIAGWWIIAMQTFIDPTIYVRTASASNESIARKAILWSVVCWVVFDVLQLISGLAAAQYVPSSEIATSYLALSQIVLPPWGRGLVLAGIIAAVSSTLNGYALASATALADDVLPALRPEISGWGGRYRVGLAVTVMLGAVIAIAVPSIIDLIFGAASIVVSALLVPTLVSHTRHAPLFTSSILSAMLLPATAAAWALLTQTAQPALVGIGTSLMLHSALWLKGKHRS
jgi:SSS family solute:Na+ symporter